MTARERLVAAAAAPALRIPLSAIVGLADLCTGPRIVAGAQGRVALFFARPIVARVVAIRRESTAITLRPGENLVADRIGMRLHIGPGLVTWIGGGAITWNHLAQLGERTRLVNFVFGAMEIIGILGDHHAIGIVPWPFADAVARVDRGLTGALLGAEIGVPGIGPVARCSPRAIRTMRGRAGAPLQIGAARQTDTGDEKIHRMPILLGPLPACTRLRKGQTGTG